VQKDPMISLFIIYAHKLQD